MELSQLVREIENAPDPHAPERIARSRSKVLRAISHTPAHRNRRRHVAFALAGATGVAAALLALVAITVNLIPAGSGSPVASPSVQTSETPSAGEVVGSWGSLGFDVDPVAEVSELMEFSQAGVIGEVAGYTQGELTTNDPLSSSTYLPVLLQIDHIEVVAGGLTAPEKSVFITLPGTASPEEYAKRVPAGTPVVAYLNDITSLDGGVGMTLVTGAPASATIYTVTHPSGLAFEFGHGGQSDEPSTSSEDVMLVFPFMPGVAQGMGVSQLVPGERVPALHDLQG